MTMQPGSLRYNLPTNDFSINPTGTEDGWVPLYLSPNAESLTKEDLETWAEKLGGQNQSRLYVDNSSPLASDSKNNRGNSKLRPFKTIERALVEAARVSFKKNPENTPEQNDKFERISISVAPGEYEVQNGPRRALDIFSNYDQYLDASRLVAINRDSIVNISYDQLPQQYANLGIKQDLEYLVNSLVEDLTTGGNYYILKFAKSLVTKDSSINISNPPPSGYFIDKYSDGGLRASLNEILNQTLIPETIKAVKNLGVEKDFSIDIELGALESIEQTITDLVGIVIDTFVCEEDPRDPNLVDFGEYNQSEFPIKEPTKADLQRFNSLNRSGIILPRGVSIVGEDLRKVVIRPTYVPDPSNSSAPRGAIFRMTGGNFFSGFTIKDRKTEGLPNYSHHKLSAFEFCNKIDLDIYYNVVNTAFSDGSIYSRALVASRLIEANEDWIENNSISPEVTQNSEVYSKIYEGEIHSFLVALQRDLKDLTNKNSMEWGARFYETHILTIDNLTEREFAKTYYKEEIDYTYQFVIRAIVNSGEYVDLENVDSEIENFTFPEEGGNTYSGRNADVQAAIFTYKEIAKDLIDGIEPTQTEFSKRFTTEDIEIINEENSIVLGLESTIEEEDYSESKINTVRGASPYIFSASIRSEYGLCGIDGNGDDVTGLRSYLAAQFTIVSLQKDPNAFVSDNNLVGNKRYKGSLPTDIQDWRHFGYRVDNEAYSQLVSCFCIGPAIHYVAEGGAEFSITNSTSNFGDISLYSKGFVDNNKGGGAYPQDQGHKLVGIKKPAPLNEEPQNFTIGYLRNEGTLLDTGSLPQTGKIFLSGELRDYGYNLIGSIVRVNAGFTPSRAEIKTIEVVNNVVELGVEFLTDFDTTWNTDPSSDQYIFGIVGKPIYIRRFVDTRDNTDKFYKLILEKSSNPDTRKPVLNYVLRKGNVSNAESQPFNDSETGRLFYLGEINETDSSYECLFISAYSDDQGRIRYYDDLLESANLGDIANVNPEDLIDPDLNNFSQLHNLLNKFDLQEILDLLGITVDDSDLKLTENQEFIFNPELDLSLEFNKPSVIRCSGHTWEYLGYLNYDSSIPKLQTKNIGFGLNEEETTKLKLLKAQTEVVAGRVYATGMDEEGNQYIGNRILDLKSGNEKVVSRGDAPAFEPQIVSVFENLTVRNKLDSNNTETENLLVKSSFTTENLAINDNSIIINADASGNAQDQRLILTRNYTQQNDPLEFFIPPNTGQPNQVLTTDGLGYLRWATPYSNVIISDQTPNLRNDGTNLESGDLWWRSNGGELFIYYDDQSIEVGDDFNASKQWVEVGGDETGASVLLEGAQNVIVSLTPPEVRESGSALKEGDLWWKFYEDPEIPGELWLYYNNQWNSILYNENVPASSTWVKTAEFLGDAPTNLFGWSVSLSADGSVLAVGVPLYVNEKGLARIYKNVNGTWTQVGNDITTTFSVDQLGRSISLSGDGSIVAIGAPATNGYTGSVRIYQNVGGNWTQIGNTIVGQAYTDYFGRSISLSEDGLAVAIGAPFKDISGLNDVGRVQIYENIDGTWTQVGNDISGEEDTEYFGHSVSLSADGTIIAIGAPLKDISGLNDVGRVQIYENIDGTWTQVGNNIDGEAAGDRFGWSVSLSSDSSVVAIGAYSNDFNGEASGYARIYQNANGTWTQLGSVINDLNLGYTTQPIHRALSLSADGSVVAIGVVGNDNSGHVRVFEWNTETTEWELLGAAILGETPGVQLGYNVSLSSDGTALAIGSPYSSINGSNSGAARVYKLVQTVSRTVLDPSRIPDLDASKITTGTFESDRIPDLDASKIATGTIEEARLPELPQPYLYRHFIF